MRFKYLYTRVSIVIRASYIYSFSLFLYLSDRVLLIFVSYDNIYVDIYIPAVNTKNKKCKQSHFTIYKSTKKYRMIIFAWLTILKKINHT